jgi:hypothetical protein
MKRTRTLSCLSLALTSLGLSALLGGPSVSSAKAGPTPPPPAAVGCYDVAASDNGAPTYQRFVQKIEQSPSSTSTPLAPTYNKATVTLTDRGVIHADLPLGGTSCVDATYVISVFDDATSALIATARVPGDGVSSILPVDVVVNDHRSLTVLVQGRVEDAYGRTIDTLPAAPRGVTAKGDGTLGGGGSAFWG